MHPPPIRKGRSALDADVVALLLENVSPEDSDGLGILQTHVAAITRVEVRSPEWLSRFALLAVRRAVLDAADRREADERSEPLEVMEALHLLALGNYATPERQSLGAAGTAMFSAVHSSEEILADLRAHGSKRRLRAANAAGLRGDHSIYKHQALHVWVVASAVVSAVNEFARDSRSIADVAAETDSSSAPGPALATQGIERTARRRRWIAVPVALIAVGALVTTASALNQGIIAAPSNKSTPPAMVATIREVGQVANGDIMRIQPLPSSGPTPTFSALAQAKIGDTIMVRERLDSVGPYAISKPTLKWRATTGADSFASVFAEISGDNLNPNNLRAQTTVNFTDSARACLAHVPDSTTISLVDGSGEQHISDSLVTEGVELPTLDLKTYRVSTLYKVEAAADCH